MLATITFYYENYVPGSVATRIPAQFHIGFLGLVFVLVAANLLGAFSSLFAGLARLHQTRRAAHPAQWPTRLNSGSATVFTERDTSATG